MKQRPVTLTIELMTALPISVLRKVTCVAFRGAAIYRYQPDEVVSDEFIVEDAKVNVIRPAKAKKARKAKRRA